MAERREWILVALVVVVVLAVGIRLAPSGYVYGGFPRLSTHLAAPNGAAALYRTLQELGIEVDRWEAPLADVGPIPRTLAILAPAKPLTPGEAATVLGTVRSGGALLWVPSWRDPLIDSLGLHIRSVKEDEEGVRVRPDPWTEGMDSVGGFARAFVGRGLEGGDMTPLLTTRDTLVLAFAATLGRGRIVALADPHVLQNQSISESGVAPLVVRAAASFAQDGPMTFDEFHHGFSGGSVWHGLAVLLGRHPLGHVVVQMLVVGLLALVLVSARLGAPREAGVGTRRSPLEHVVALGEVYRQASAVRIPRRLLMGGLARALGEPPPRSNEEMVRLLRRLEARGGTLSEQARSLRADLERGEADVLAVARGIDGIRKELGR